MIPQPHKGDTAAPPTPYILYRMTDGQMYWPQFDTTDGRYAVIYFSSEERALRFRDGKGMGPDWLVAPMDHDEFIRWLRHNLDAGRPLVLQDPEPNMGTAVEIARFLAQLDPGGGSQSPAGPPPKADSSGSSWSASW